MSVHVLLCCCCIWLALLSGSVLAALSPILKEGDIVVAAGFSARAIATGEESQLWPAGVIPYTIDVNLPPASIEVIEIAIARWNLVPGISLRPLDNIDALAAFSTRDIVKFVSGEFCASWVGRRGGIQNLWVSPNCLSGGVMHEIGHLIGLEHEHTRSDRDQYIQIHWDNIDPDKLHNFDAAPAGAMALGEYDYDSIMHYGSSNFSRNGLPTLSRLDGSNEEIGQRRALSDGDLQAVRALYGTDLSLATLVDNGSTALDIYVSNESSRGANTVSIDIPAYRLSDDWRVRERNDSWNCQLAGKDAVACTLDRLPGSAVEHLRLPLAEGQSAESVDVTLTSQTPDFDPSNNVSRSLTDDAGLAEQLPQEIQLVSAATLAATLDSKLPIQQDGNNVVTTGAVNPVFLCFAWLVLLLNRLPCCRINRCLLPLVSRIRKIGV